MASSHFVMIASTGLAALAVHVTLVGEKCAWKDFMSSSETPLKNSSCNSGGLFVAMAF